MKHLLFLSHAGSDAAAARELARRIEEVPLAQKLGLAVWVDRRDLRAGARWQEEIEETIDHTSTAFACYVSPKSVVNWVEREVRLAVARSVREPDYPVIPILGDRGAVPDGLPALLRQHHAVSAVEEDPAELEKLILAAARESPMDGPRLVDQPFIGLRPFQEADAHLFFGREPETDALIEQLRRADLVMVIGDSGSGKSSLVRAGLLPRFRGGALALPGGLEPDRTVWQPITTRPRSNPFEALADDLARSANEIGAPTGSRIEIKELVRSRKPEFIRDALVEFWPPETRVLLVVDQFEELFTLCDEESRARFLETLLYLVRTEGSIRIQAVLTMRRDYYNLCSSHAGFYSLLEGGDAAGCAVKVALRRISDEGLRRCITEPLRMAGKERQELFVDHVLRDVGDQPGELALIQIALAESWRRRQAFSGNLLEALVSVRGVAGALATLADELYEKCLSSDERKLIETSFLRLVRLAERGGTTRRIALRDEFTEPAWTLLQKLAGPEYRRLVVIGGGERGEFVELAHEALVTQWHRFQEWIRSAANEKRIIDELMEGARRWNLASDEQFFLTGSRLQEASYLLRTRPEWLTPIEARFIQESERYRIRQSAKLVSGADDAEMMLYRGVAHDVNNAVGAALPLVQQLRADIERGAADRDTILKDLEVVLSSLQTVRRIFGGMLAYARQKPHEGEGAEIRPAVQTALSILHDGMNRRRIEPSLDLPEALPAVACSREDLTSLFLNVCTNSVDAMPHGGHLSITARSGEDGVTASVSDTGIGIPENNLGRIRTPFFTTKPAGTGIGLAVCDAIVKDMGGELSISSQVGKGTTVILRLPLEAARGQFAESHRNATGRAEPSPESPGG